MPIRMRACSLHIYTVCFRHNYTQPLKYFTTQDLCALAKRLEIDYCVSFFKQQKVDGLEMVLFTEEEFVSMLKTTTGELFISVSSCNAFLLQLLMHLSRADVNNAKALKAWARLQPLLSSSKSADNANTHVSPFCIVL